MDNTFVIFFCIATSASHSELTSVPHSHLSHEDHSFNKISNCLESTLLGHWLLILLEWMAMKNGDMLLCCCGLKSFDVRKKTTLYWVGLVYYYQKKKKKGKEL